jgi:hypothetical protein
MLLSSFVILQSSTEAALYTTMLAIGAANTFNTHFAASGSSHSWVS